MGQIILVEKKLFREFAMAPLQKIKKSIKLWSLALVRYNFLHQKI
jgi:hypothetical protein